MDNEISKITNAYFVKRIYTSLKILYRGEREDSWLGYPLSLTEEEVLFTYETSERQRQHMRELRVVQMRLFYQRLEEIIRVERIKNALIDYDEDLYKESLLMLREKSLQYSEFLPWSRDVAIAMKRMTQQNYFLYTETYIFCQLLS